MSKINDILRKLKRYSFESKMGISYEFSAKAIGKDFTFSFEQSKNIPLPWHLETFVMLSIKATPEYNNLSFDGKNIYHFYRMINAINSTPEIKDNTNEGIFEYISSIAIQQFEYQEPPKYRLYRYKYLFNYQDEKIDMKKIFNNYFNCSYDDFAMIYTVLLVLTKNYSKANLIYALTYLFKEYPNVFYKMSLTIDDYKNQLNTIIKDIDDYANCYCPSITYPFVICDEKAYFPLPHLISKAFTSSVMYRITQNDNNLRSLIGKNVLESYTYHLLKEADIYSEVYKEKIYLKEGQEARTVDALVRENDEYLFIDCKMHVPKSSLRQINKNDYNNDADRLAEYGERMYKNIKIYRKKYKEYSPFNNDICDIKDDSFYGIIVLLEDSYIERRMLYSKIANKCDINKDTAEYDWLTRHIKIIDFYELELHCVHGISIINSIKQTDDPYSFVLTIKDRNNRAFERFTNEITDVFDNATALALKIFINKEKRK